jgi:hypothetical protein
LVRRLSPDTKVVVRSLGNKPAVFERGPDVARELVETDHCDLVLIVWDLKPLWERPGSCVNEADHFRSAVSGMNQTIIDRIRLLCLTYELETWLLADPAALKAHLSTAAHPARLRRINDPSSHADAKAVIDGECIRHRGRGRRYTDYREAILIARRWDSTARLRAVSSFSRFLDLVTGNPAAEFVLGGDACNDLCHAGAMMGRQ